MKTIGLLGGMSWESTTEYYQTINRLTRSERGDMHSAEIVLFSVDFQVIERLQHQGKWQETGEILASAAKKVETAGAEFLLVCTNTMHKVTPTIEAQLNIPLLHIADATGEKLQADGIKTVGLLGTAFTMEQAFYKQRLTEKFGIEVLIPPEKERADIHRIIYHELCKGTVKPESRDIYLDSIAQLAEHGAQGVILGCTEIGMLVKQEHTTVTLYDTTQIHAEKAVEFALQDAKSR